MAQRAYTAEGLVLRKQHIGESSVYALILTSEHGLVRVRAQSARNISGKLRYALEPMTLGRFTFVRGREVNRLIGAEAHECLFAPTREARQASGQISKLLVRLMPGEGADPQLFLHITAGLRYLSQLPEADVPFAECAIVLMILAKLGYLPEDETFARLAEEPLTDKTIEEMRVIKSKAVQIINVVLSASGL